MSDKIFIEQLLSIFYPAMNGSCINGANPAHNY